MRYLTVLTGVVLAAGCGADARNGADVFEPQFSRAGNSGCYTVSGEIAQTGVFPSFTGSITGDIEGTVLTQFDPTSRRVAGRVTFTSGLQTWDVTGGSVPELVGQKVVLTLESEVVLARPPVGRNSTTARIVSGAEAGNLTYHGTVITSPPPPFATNVTYRGVICP